MRLIKALVFACFIALMSSGIGLILHVSTGLVMAFIVAMLVIEDRLPNR